MRLWQCFSFLLVNLLFFQDLGFAKELLNSAPKINLALGDTFLVPNNNPSNPERLEENQSLTVSTPYSLVTAKESFLEVSNLSSESQFTLRLGQSTGIEIRDPFHLFLFKGSALIADLESNSWTIESNMSQLRMYGSGTYIIETTPIGFKVLLLEGKFTTNNKGSEEKILQSGDLALITERDGRISQSLQIELPLLLSTSRLVNYFSKPLATHSRLISAAQVQVLRMQTKYDAFIGGVSEDRKLRIWKLNSKKNKEE